jgi:hypothetical protein
MSMSQSGIAVRAYHRPLGFLLELVSVTIQVDGIPHKRRWGDSFFPLPPGRHEVEVWSRWTFFRHYGRNNATVDVNPGVVQWIQWTAPASVFQKGRIDRLDAEVLPSPVGSAQRTERPDPTYPPPNGPPQGYDPARYEAQPIPARPHLPAGSHAAWLHDPVTENGYRYFDGTRWTEWVYTGSYVSVSHLPGP